MIAVYCFATGVVICDVNDLNLFKLALSHVWTTPRN